MKKNILLSLIFSSLFTLGTFNSAHAQWVQANTGLTINEVNSIATIGTTIFAGTGNATGNGQGVFKSTDNGDNWVAVNTGFLTLDIKQIIAVGTSLYAALGGTNITDGGIYKSTDMGATWVQSCTGLNRNFALNVAHLNGTLYCTTTAPASQREVYTSIDGAANWVLTPDDVLNNNKTKSIVTIGGNILLASDGGEGGVYLSTDNGATWSLTHAGGSDGLAVVGSTVFAAKGNGVFKSVDNGVNWTATTNVSGVVDNATAIIAVGSTLLVATPSGRVFSTVDDGTTWVDMSTSGAGLAAEAFGMDANYVYAGIQFTAVGVWRRPLSDFAIPGAPDAPSGLELTPMKTQMAGQMVLAWSDNSSNEDAFVIERSTDGSNWTEINNTVTVATYTDNGLADATLYYYRVAAFNTSGTSAWSNEASGTTLAVGIDIPAEANAFTIYPNPASDRVNIQWSGAQNAVLKVYNILGGEIINQTISKEIDLSAQPSGIYFVNVYDGANCYSRKISVE